MGIRKWGISHNLSSTSFDTKELILNSFCTNLQILQIFTYLWSKKILRPLSDHSQLDSAPKKKLFPSLFMPLTMMFISLSFVFRGVKSIFHCFSRHSLMTSTMVPRSGFNLLTNIAFGFSDYIWKQTFTNDENNCFT